MRTWSGMLAVVIALPTMAQEPPSVRVGDSLLSARQALDPRVEREGLKVETRDQLKQHSVEYLAPFGRGWLPRYAVTSCGGTVMSVRWKQEVTSPESLLQALEVFTKTAKARERRYGDLVTRTVPADVTRKWTAHPGNEFVPSRTAYELRALYTMSPGLTYAGSLYDTAELTVTLDGQTVTYHELLRNNAMNPPCLK